MNSSDTNSKAGLPTANEAETIDQMRQWQLDELRSSNHKLQLESELRAIEARVLRARSEEVRQLEDRLRKTEVKLAEYEVKLAEYEATTDDHEVVDGSELARLRDAEYHFVRLLGRVDNSPARLLARRKWGYRKMADRWL